MKLYRIKDTVTGLFYRHRSSSHRGGNWLGARFATIWTKRRGADEAISELYERAWRRRKTPTFVVETATIDPTQLEWK